MLVIKSLLVNYFNLMFEKLSKSTLGARGFLFRSEATIVSGIGNGIGISMAALPLTIAASLRKKSWYPGLSKSH